MLMLLVFFFFFFYGLVEKIFLFVCFARGKRFVPVAFSCPLFVLCFFFFLKRKMGLVGWLFVWLQRIKMRRGKLVFGRDIGDERK